MTFDKTVELLTGLPPGSYLFRLSASSPNTAVVAYVTPTHRVVQSLLYALPHTPKRDCIQDEHMSGAVDSGFCAAGHQFATMSDMLQAFSGVLQFPVQQSGGETAVYGALPAILASTAENTDSISNRECGVCYDKEWNAALLCGHTVCEQCALQLVQRNARCPYCRRPAESYIKLFAI